MEAFRDAAPPALDAGGVVLGATTRAKSAAVRRYRAL